MDPLSFIFILKTAAQCSSLWIVMKKMIDLHYMRTLVLNVEVETRKSHRKTRAQPHRRTLCFEEGFQSLLFSLQSWMSLGQTGSCFLNVTVPTRVTLWPSSAPDAVKMPWWSLCSPPPSPRPANFSSPETSCQSCGLEEVSGINLPEHKATF